MQTESVLKVFCVELPLDNNGKETKENFKVTGKTVKHSIHVHKSLDEKNSSSVHIHVYPESCVCAVFANCMVYRWLARQLHANNLPVVSVQSNY